MAGVPTVSLPLSIVGLWDKGPLPLEYGRLHIGKVGGAAGRRPQPVKGLALAEDRTRASSAVRWLNSVRDEIEVYNSWQPAINEAARKCSNANLLIIGGYHAYSSVQTCRLVKALRNT